MTDTTPSTSARKQALRKLMRERKAMHDPESRLSASRIIAEKLESMPAFREARCILLYHNLPDEVVTTELIARWHGQKRILLPVVVGDDLVLTDYRPERMHTGSFGISEPEGEPFTDYDAIDLAIIPGMGFDPHGNRLGRGRGYYDRLLPRLKAPLVGIAFSWQLVEEVPVEPHDRRVDSVITDSK